MTTQAPGLSATVTASAFPIPYDNPSAFYKATIGGVDTPGVIPPGGLEGWDLVFGWDAKAGKGLNDATITDKGDEPPTGKIKWQIWRRGTGNDPNDFADDDAFYTMLVDAKNNKKALDITHPIVNQARVTAVVPKVIGGLKDEGTGLFTRTVEFLKWVPQPTAATGGTPAGANNTPAPEQPGAEQQDNDPNAALRAHVVRHLDEASQ